MGWLNALLPIVSAVGQKMLNNYETQSKARAAERQDLLTACSQYHPKILDNYYSTSRIENILKEKDVNGDADSQATRRYYRDNYYFAGAYWGQVFEFTPVGCLGKIALIHDWDPNLYSHICQTLGATCVITFVSDGEYNAYFNDAADGEEWTQTIVELEQSGLKKSCFKAVFADSWIFDYMIAKDSLPDDFINFLQMLPMNGRLITLDITEEFIILHFESAYILKNSQF